MKKSMCILVFSAVLLTGCGGAETMEIEIPAVATKTVSVTETERTAAEVTTATTAKPQKTTAKTTEITLISETRKQIQIVTEGTQLQTEKLQEKNIAVQEESPEIVQNSTVTTAPVQTTDTPKSITTAQIIKAIVTTTTVQATTTISKQSEEEKPTAIGSNLSHDGTDYGKALAVYEYMSANGSGTCVNYAYQTYYICKDVGLECYFAWTSVQLYGHVANVVKVDGAWYVLDTQAGCFLTENLCGFTEIVDENENFISNASMISEIRYDQL